MLKFFIFVAQASFEGGYLSTLLNFLQFVVLRLAVIDLQDQAC